ncbi:FAD-dependent oxidoreductase [Luedemannella flava]
MTSDVVVAGGGLIGMSVAWRCAQKGLRVTVVDPDPTQGAGQAAAGMLAPVAEASYGEERLLGLARASLKRYPAFVASCATPPDWTSACVRPARCRSASTPTISGRWTSCTPSTWSWACRPSGSRRVRPADESPR